MLQGTIKYIKLILMLIVSLFLMYSSMLKLVSFPGMEESFMAWGYGKTFMYVIGVVELLLSILLFIPKTRIWGAVLIMILMSGALYTHITNFEYDQLSSAIFVSSACAVIVLVHFVEKHYFSSAK